MCVCFVLQIGKAEKLKPMELELRRLEDLAESIVNDFAYMRAREEEMRDTNGMWFGECWNQSCLFPMAKPTILSD